MGMEGKLRMFLLSRPGLFELDGLAPLPLSRVAIVGLFLGVNRTIGEGLGLPVVLDLEVLCTDSLVTEQLPST